MKNKIKKAYKNKSYVLIKNAINLKSFGLNFDFNSLYDFLNIYPVGHYSVKEKVYIFSLCNIFNEQTSSFFITYLSFISNVLQDILKFNLGNLDFFFSTKGQRGESHVDREHVLILGVYKNTYYHVDGKDIKVCPGDILYIYKNNLHHVFSPTERIVLSLSVWESA